MAFPISAALLDAIVLAVVARESTYGYKITQDVRQVMEVSTRQSRGASGAITRLRPRGRKSLRPTAPTGSFTAIPLNRS